MASEIRPLSQAEIAQLIGQVSRLLKTSTPKESNPYTSQAMLK
jgi:hypothetical protein